MPECPDADGEPADDLEAAVDAGPFGSWLEGVFGVLRAGGESTVPCAGCTACCRSSQFVVIAPDERATLARIPTDLRFPAPGLPRGHVVLGYDERGHCPLLVDDRCSIYADRPRACRTYDCRVVTAAAVTLEPEKGAIAARTRRWRFSYADPADEARHAAIRRAAAFLATHARALGSVPPSATARAVLALGLHERFFDPGAEPAVNDIRAAIAALAPPPPAAAADPSPTKRAARRRSRSAPRP